MTSETRNKIGIKLKNKNLSIEHKDAISKGMQLVVRSNPKSYSSSNINGRTKRVKYKNIILDSNWELEFAKWLDKNNIKWERPVNGFEYKWNGKRIYYPDFYLPVFDLYVEVKGYIRDRDYLKWSSIPNLIILKKNDIKLIKKNEWALSSVGQSNRLG